MSKNATPIEERAKRPDGKFSITAVATPELIKSLDNLADEIKKIAGFRPNRSQLILMLIEVGLNNYVLPGR